MRVTSLIAVGALALAACAESPSEPGVGPELVAVTPAAGSVGVRVDEALRLEFSAAMAPGSERHVSLHVGDLAGPMVPGAASWSSDHRLMTFRPDTPLQAGTRYSLHVGGEMRDHAGHALDGLMHPDAGGRHDASHHVGNGMGDGMMHPDSTRMELDHGGHDPADCGRTVEFMTE